MNKKIEDICIYCRYGGLNELQRYLGNNIIEKLNIKRKRETIKTQTVES